MNLEVAIKIARARNPLAKKNGKRLQRHVAILTNGRVMWVGINSWRTSTLQAMFRDREDRIACHAEIHCLEQAIRHFSKINGHARRDHAKVDLSEFRLSVARVLSDGSVGASKPCLGCASALARFKVKGLEWT